MENRCQTTEDLLHAITTPLKLDAPLYITGEYGGKALDFAVTDISVTADGVMYFHFVENHVRNSSF